MSDKIIGYKGFDKDLKCRGMQYEVGKAYEAPYAVLCESGLHFCTSPLDCLSYYPPGAGSRYARVEAEGTVVGPNGGGDSKMAATVLTVTAEMSLDEMIRAAAKTTGDGAHSVTAGDFANSATTGDCAHSVTTGGYAHSVTAGGYANSATTGDCANSATTGDCANSVTTGDFANSATTGDGANSSVSGKQSIAAALGAGGRARGALGCWIVLAEYAGAGIACVKTAKVDGETIKADTWYTLRGGEFVEVGDE